MTVKLHYKTALKIDASNVYCKITLVWLYSSLSVVWLIACYCELKASSQRDESFN